MSDVVIGIDPGVNGGICVRYDKSDTIFGDYSYETYRLPKNLIDIQGIIRRAAKGRDVVIFVEKVSARTDDVFVTGGRANMGKLFRIQKMVAGFERLRVICELSGCPVFLVHPATWQSYLDIRQKGEEKADRKRRFRDVAEKLAGYKQTLWSADAVLISEFGYKMIRNSATDKRAARWMKENAPDGFGDNATGEMSLNIGRAKKK